MAHRHTIATERTSCWSTCIADGDCDGLAHGNIVITQTCTCGATRASERNAGHVVTSRWVAAPRTQEVTRV